MRLYYHLTNIDPLVISQSAATTNNHKGLDYIPGSAMLGVFASCLYPKLTPEQSFALFQSGACQFGPAYPQVDGEIALPIPAAWHTEKLDSSSLSNHSVENFQRDEQKQYKQCRSGFIAHKTMCKEDRISLRFAEVKQLLTTRTALDDKQRAKEGQLYTYATLAADQQFVGWIEADGELLKLLEPHINSEYFIGRSRFSEFGRVVLQQVGTSPSALAPFNLNKNLVIWCLSDTVFYNAQGLPTLTPAASDLHPALKGRLEFSRSFIRTHKTRRFNRARGGFDSEQQIVTKGSVLSFTLDTAASDEVLADMAQKGVGSQRQQGHGWVAVNPTWAAQVAPSSEALFSPFVVGSPVTKQASITATDASLIQWVSERLDRSEQVQKTKEKLSSIYVAIESAYQNMRHYNNIKPHHQAGPSRSQWRRLDELVKQNTSTWQEKAFEGDAAICKADNDSLGWGLDWQQGDTHTSFASYIQRLLGGLDYSAMRQLLEDICRYDLSTSRGLSDFKTFIDKSQRGQNA